MRYFRVAALVCLDYDKNNGMAPLPGTRKDLMKGQAVLRKCGFERHILHGRQRRSELRGFIDRFVDRVRELVEEDLDRKVIVYFHFSGHGLKRPGSEWPSLISSEYCFGEDSQLEMHSKVVFGMLNGINKGHDGLQIVMCLDCCRDGDSFHQYQENLLYRPDGDNLIPYGVDSGQDAVVGGRDRSAGFRYDVRNTALVLFSCGYGKTAPDHTALSQVVWKLFPQQVDIPQWGLNVTRAVKKVRGERDWKFRESNPEYLLVPDINEVILAGPESPPEEPLEEPPLPPPAFSPLALLQDLIEPTPRSTNGATSWWSQMQQATDKFLQALQPTIFCNGGGYLRPQSDDVDVGGPEPIPGTSLAEEFLNSKTVTVEGLHAARPASSAGSTSAASGSLSSGQSDGLGGENSADWSISEVDKSPDGHIEVKRPPREFGEPETWARVEFAGLQKLQEALRRESPAARVQTLYINAKEEGKAVAKLLKENSASLQAVREFQFEAAEAGTAIFIVEALSAMPQLTHLTISCDFFREEKLAEALVSALKNLQNLELLDLGSPRNILLEDSCLVLLIAFYDIYKYQEKKPDFCLPPIDRETQASLLRRARIPLWPKEWSLS